MADPMVKDGAPVRGTPLWRVSLEIGSNPEVEFFHFHAGEIRDVARACDPKAKPAADALKLTDGKEPGEKVRVRAEDAKALVAAALGK